MAFVPDPEHSRRALEQARIAGDWPRPTLAEDDMLASINADGGFPVRIVLDGRTYDVRRAA